MESQYILRRSKSKKGLIITLLVLFLIFFFFMVYCTYLYLAYTSQNNISDPDIYSTIMVLGGMFSQDTSGFPITADLLITILRMQVESLWWVYLSIVLITFVAMTSRTRSDFKGVEHGSARWATKEEMKPFQDKGGIPVAKDFYVPINGGNGVVANLNEIVIGGSGAGKTFRKIKPDIMQMTGSYVVTDPKGELYRDTAKLLMDNGYNVRVLNLINPSLSNSYNPFQYMTSEDDVVNICALFMKNSAEDGEKGDFWTGSALDLLTAVSIYLFKSETETKSFGRVLRLINSIRYKQSYIDTSCELGRCLNKHATLYPFDAASTNWNGLQGTPEETLGGVVKTLATRLRLWSTHSIDSITVEDETDFDSVGAEKTAIFLIIPAGRQTYRVVANIFYSQLFERLMRVAETKYNGRLPLLVSCELDEFPNIGEIPAFSETLSVVRSYNIRCAIVLQGLSQLKAIYEKTWESIIGNCDIFTFLGSKDTDTLEYISKKLGDITVRTDSKSFNRGQQGGGQDSQSYSARPLLKPNEIKQAIKPKGKNRKYGGGCIIFLGYEHPFYLPKFDTLNHPMIDHTGSSFEKDYHNNTDINYVYEPIKRARMEKYNALMEQNRNQAIREETTYLAEMKKKEQDEQERLKREFENDSSDEDLSPPDPDMPETDEDEIIEFDEYDDLDDDTNPILEKLVEEEINEFS